MTYANPPTHDVALPQLKLNLMDVWEEVIALLRLAVPIMLIALVNMGMSITDAVMVSASFGADALAAVAVGSDFYSIVFYFGAGTIGGVVPYYAAAVARGDLGQRARIERSGLVVVLILVAILVPVVWTAPDWLGGLGLDQTLLEAGRGYTQTMALTLIPMLGVMLYRTVLTAAQRPKVFLYVTMGMLPLNALGNLVLMHGVGPIPAFGATGAGISTFLVALVSLSVLVVIARRSAPIRRADKVRIGWSDVAPILRLGVPIGIATVAEVGIFLGATLFAATLGPAEVAAHTLTLRIAGVAYAVPAALLQAAMVRMARAEAQSRPNDSHRVAISALALGLVAGTFLLVILTSIAAPLADAFFDATPVGSAAARMSISLLMLLGIMEFIAAPGLAAAGLLRGQKDTRLPMIFTVGGYWLIGAPLGVWLCSSWELGIIGVWVGLACGTAATSLLMLLRLRRLKVMAV